MTTYTFQATRTLHYQVTVEADNESQAKGKAQDAFYDTPPPLNPVNSGEGSTLMEYLWSELTVDTESIQVVK